MEIEFKSNLHICYLNMFYRQQYICYKKLRYLMLLDFNSNANSKVNNTCNTYRIRKKSLLESFKGIPLISNRCNHVELGIYLLSPFIWKSVGVLNNDTSSCLFQFNRWSIPMQCLVSLWLGSSYPIFSCIKFVAQLYIQMKRLLHDY